MYSEAWQVKNGVRWSRHSRKPAERESGRGLLHRKPAVVPLRVPNESRPAPPQPLVDEVLSEVSLAEGGQSGGLHHAAPWPFISGRDPFEVFKELKYPLVIVTLLYALL